MQFPPDEWLIRVEDLFALAVADEMQDEPMSAQLLIHVDKNATIRGNFKLVIHSEHTLKVRKL
jgi:hypothetical protein